MSVLNPQAVSLMEWLYVNDQFDINSIQLNITAKIILIRQEKEFKSGLFMKDEISDEIKTSIIKFRDYVKYKTQTKDFHWLIQHLTSPSLNLKGWEINITEWVFFNNAKPEFMIKKDKDGCLLAITQPSKLQFYIIRRTLHNIIRARKRGISLNENADSRLDKLKDIDFSKENKTIKLNSNNSPARISKKTMSDFGMSPKFENKEVIEPSDINKDSAIFRFRDGSSKIVGDSKLSDDLSQSANVNFWKEVKSIHTLVKWKVGLGMPINIVLPILDIDGEIDYNFKRFDNEIDFEQYPEFGLPLDKYCLKQCLKMWYYVQKVYQYEIIIMDWSFYKGENELALCYVTDIQVREMQGAGQPFWIIQNQENEISRLVDERRGNILLKLILI